MIFSKKSLLHHLQYNEALIAKHRYLQNKLFYKRI